MALKNNSILAIDFGLCRFCNNTKKCRVVDHEYEYLGQKEIYSDMLLDTFGLLLANLESEASEKLVCATCVVRLRAATSFKRQVQHCEEKLLAQINDFDATSTFNIKTEVDHQDDSMTMDTDSLMDASHLDVQVEDSQLDDTESFYDIEVLEESILGSEDEETNCRSDQLLEVKLEQDIAEADSSSEAAPSKRRAPGQRRAPSERRPPSVRSPPSERIAHPRERETPKERSTPGKRSGKDTESAKSALAYRNEPTKEVMMERMRKLKALMANQKKDGQPIKPTKPIHIPKRRDGKTKEMLMQENTITVVENSYVCPFNNITGNYYCYYCRAIFTDPELLREHTLSHEPKPYFRRNWSLRRAPKLDITRIDCRHCDQTIDNIPDLKAHLTAEHNKKFYNATNEFLSFKLTYPEIQCLECGGKFFFIDKLIDHMAEHFGKYICEQCGAAFVQYGSLQAHVRSHKKTGVRFPCHICGKTLSTNRSRRVHVAVVHEKKCVIDCPTCDERFLNYEMRNRHMEEAHGYVRKIPCTKCDRTFDNRKSFLNHLASKHSSKSEHEYQCQLCDKSFPLLSYMKKHVRAQHGSKQIAI